MRRRLLGAFAIAVATIAAFASAGGASLDAPDGTSY
jgi:hypothetical protein